MRPFVTFGIALAMATIESLGNTPAAAQSPADFPIHSMTRPQPPVVDPGPLPGMRSPPSDAIVLSDGGSLGSWQSADSAGHPARWKVADGYMEVVAGAGNIATVRGFGDVQLHIEWMAPVPAKGEGQERGNSGVFLMGIYEIQVLDSYHNPTYPDGQAGAIYGQYPPLVNASRPPGEWQTYDVLFHRPRFDANGSVTRPARMTIFFNGILVQDDVALTGPTAHKQRPPYTKHDDRLPLVLQDHGDPVRFRNIWVRELPNG
jgi:3-keto-disaccharide hydrolase